MKICLCKGNIAMKDREHIRSIAEKAAAMDGVAYILYLNGDVYGFCREDEEFPGELIEYVLP